MTHTRTRTHTGIKLANPHLICAQCRKPVTAWHDNTACGCKDTFWLVPCGCRRADVVNTCPSWDPVDGCTCAEPHTA